MRSYMNDRIITLRYADIIDIKKICDIMLGTEPYTVLGYTKDVCFDIVIDSIEEGRAVVAEVGEDIAGFILFRIFEGFPLGGYIRALAVSPRFRGLGVGSSLVRFAEETIFRYRDNVFLLVSSFNYNAIRFYRSLGYEVVGEIRDAIIEGESEYIMRKKRRTYTGRGS
ncbi:MAG: GNAT family N-acetyltransferase [Sulfolobales archaeon]